MPVVVTAAVPMRRPLVTNGDLGSPGIWLLVESDARLVEGLLGDLAGQVGVEAAQVDQHQVVVGAARDDPEALGRQRPRQGPGVAYDLGRVLLELGLRSPRGRPPPWRR